jgi:hypothetical protein
VGRHEVSNFCSGRVGRNQPEGACAQSRADVDECRSGEPAFLAASSDCFSGSISPAVEASCLTTLPPSAAETERTEAARAWRGAARVLNEDRRRDMARVDEAGKEVSVGQGKAGGLKARAAGRP